MANELDTVLQGSTRVSMAEEREHELPMFAKRTIKLPSNQQTRIEYDGSDNPIYVGTAARGIASSASGWLVQKITWTGSNPTLIQIAYGIWDDRALLTYA